MKKESLHSRLRGFGYALRLTWRLYPQKLTATIILTVLKGVIGFFSLQYMLRYVINGAESGVPFASLLAFMLWLLAANVVFKCVDAAYTALLKPVLTRRGSARLDRQIMQKLVRLDLKDYEDPAAYDLTMRAASMGKACADGVMDVVSESLSALVQLTLSVILLIDIDPWLLVFPVIPLLLNPLNLKIDQIYIDMMRRQQELGRKKEYVRRTFYQKEYACDMRLTGMPRVMLREFQETVEKCRRLRLVCGKRLAALFFVLAFLTNATTLLAVLYAVFRTLVTHSMLIGDCLVVLNLFGEISDNVQNAARLLSWVDETALQAQDYRALMDRQPTLAAEGTPEAVPALSEIQIAGAEFAYEGAGERAIDGLTLTLHPGERVALVGENGAGKTTLAKLILRLYDVQGGEILAGGRSVRCYRPEEYRRRFAVALQEHPLLAISVADNVLGRACMREDAPLVRSALERVGLWEKVSALPRGIDTPLTGEFAPDGASFSVGEQQLLSIAGVYARDCDVVILDEPSSALDPLAERAMYETMLAACAGKTVLFITHRLSSVQDADRICLCEHGRVTEEGTHAQLMKQGGQYARMFSAQAEAYRL